MPRLPDTDLATGHALAERLRDSVATLPIALAPRADIRVTLSSGVARREPGLAAEQAAADTDRGMD